MFESRQSLQNILCSLLRQIIISRYPVQIPQGIMDAWDKARLGGKQSLTADEARSFLHDELSTFPVKYLVLDAIDEAEGCKSSIDSEIRQLRHSKICIFSTVRRDPRNRYVQVYCCRCMDGPLDLYWLCELCIGRFQTRYEVCRSCYKDKGFRCHDVSHQMKPPLKVNAEVRTSLQDLQSYVTETVDNEFQGGDIADDDIMFSGQMTRLSALRQELPPEFWTSLPTKVGNAADGNFLYAQLFMDRLRLQRTMDGALALERQLDHGTLDDLSGQYDDMLGLCLNKDDKDGAVVPRNHLALVAAAFDVLTFGQLSHAAAVAKVDRSLKDFTRRCNRKEDVRRDTNNLLTIDTSGQAESFPVFFFHSSLATYIDTTRSRWFPGAEQRMFDACLSYLEMDAFSKPFESPAKLGSAVKEYPFASYAACYWGFHARNAPASVENNLRILELIGDDERLSCIMQIAWHTRSRADSCWDVSGGIKPLHVCSFYGLEHLCRALLSAGSNPDSCDDTYNQTPLIYACRKGYAVIVELLLKAGSNPNHLSSLHKSPLLEAIEHGHEDVFDVLLSNRYLDVNLLGSGREARTALVKAAEDGRPTMVKKLLVCKDIDVNKPDVWNCTALSRAVQKLRVDCVGILLDDDRTDLTIKDSLGHRTALDWTAEHSSDYGSHSADIHRIATDLLVDRRKPKISTKAIENVIDAKKHGLLDILVKAALDCSYVDQCGRDFFHLAAAAGDFTAIRLVHGHFVKETSFSLDRVDSFKASALHAACRKPSIAHVDTIEFLLTEGADSSLGDQDGFSPPRRASAGSPGLWTSHIKNLFGPYVVSTELDSYGNDPPTIASAIQAADLDALKVILDKSSDPLDPETDQYTQCTILHMIIESEDLAEDEIKGSLELLLPRSKDFINATDIYDRTCAHYAVLQDSLPCLTLIVDAGVDVNLRDRWSLSLFELAQRHERHDMCVYLAKIGAQLPPREGIRPQVLHAAVECGEIQAVKQVVRAGIDTYYRDPVTSLTPLQRAEQKWQDAAQDVNNDFIKNKMTAYFVDLETFRRAKYGAPEVVKREKVIKFLQGVQKHVLRPQSQPSAPQDLSRLVARLKTLDPKMMLSDMEKEQQQVAGASKSPPSDEDESQSYRHAGKGSLHRETRQWTSDKALVSVAFPGLIQSPAVLTVREMVLFLVIAVMLGVVGMAVLPVQR